MKTIKYMIFASLLSIGLVTCAMETSPTKEQKRAIKEAQQAFRSDFHDQVLIAAQEISDDNDRTIFLQLAYSPETLGKLEEEEKAIAAGIILARTEIPHGQPLNPSPEKQSKTLRTDSRRKPLLLGGSSQKGKERSPGNTPPTRRKLCLDNLAIEQ